LITNNIKSFNSSLDTIENAFAKGNSIDTNLNVVSGSINNKKN